MTRLLTVDDVAERLGVTKDWVWAQARAGRIPHVQLGRYRRFREEALEQWLNELEQQSVEQHRGGGPGFGRTGWAPVWTTTRSSFATGAAWR